MNSTNANATACFFANINEILTKADARQLNITQIVKQCPNTCRLAWGNGNPDLSGIGAVVSYIIQMILTLLLGPIFCMVYGRLRKKTQERLISLQDNFLDTSAAFCITVAVASVVRLKQSAPFFEIVFLQCLTTMQFIALFLTTIVSAVVQDRLNKRKRTLIVILYLILDLGLYAGFVGGLRTSKATWTSIKELSDACNGYGALKPGFAYTHSNVLSRREIAGVVLAGGLGPLIILALPFLMIRTFSFIKHHPAILLTISFGLWIAVLFYTVQLEKERNVMQSVAGSEFSDNNQWGFGQVVALLWWGPVLVQALYTIAMTCVTPLCHERDVEQTPMQPQTTGQTARVGVPKTNKPLDETKGPAEKSDNVEATIEALGTTTEKDGNAKDDVGKDKTEKNDDYEMKISEDAVKGKDDEIKPAEPKEV